MEAEQQFNEKLYKTDTTGETVMVSFRLDREDGKVLQEICDALPRSEYGHRLSKSEMIRQLIMPYVASLKLAKQGKQWEGALEFGKQFVKLNKALRLSLQQEEQESMEKELFDEVPKTVTAIPNQA